MTTYNYKICLIGKSSVGKTSMAMRIVKDQFEPNSESTIGASFLTKHIRLDPGDILYPSEINLQIWDTAGQERYNSLLPMYTRSAAIVLLCVATPNINDFKEDIKRYKLDGIDAIIMIIITKIDVIPKSAYHELQKLCDENDFQTHYISSLTGEGFAEFNELLKKQCLSVTPTDISNHRIFPKIKLDTKPETNCCDSS